ncbi:hypothetical protein HYW83_01350 [Candidatus Peregrinibacteria bacterium]|nr:hypothetical protein [Candidatus Peregrinibacteria bacterium]
MFLDRFLRGPESHRKPEGSESGTEHLTPRHYFDGPRIDDLGRTFGRVVDVKGITPLSE